MRMKTKLTLVSVVVLCSTTAQAEPLTGKSLKQSKK